MKIVKFYFRQGSLLEFLIFESLWLAATQIWTWAEFESSFCWMNICSSDNGATSPKVAYTIKFDNIT